MKKIKIAILSAFVMICALVSVNTNAAANAYMRVLYGKTTFTDSTMLYLLQVDTVKNLTVDSAVAMTQTSAMVYITYTGDTAFYNLTVLVTGLSVNTSYICRARTVAPTFVQSNIAEFATLPCAFTPSVSDSVIDPCLTRVIAHPNGYGFTFKWLKNGALINGATLYTYDVNLTGTGNYSVTISDGVCTLTSQPLIVAVNGISLTVSAPISVCLGDSTTISADGDATDYLWTPGNLVGPSVSVKPPVTTIYTVTASNGPNCFKTATVKVTVNKNTTAITIKTTADSACYDGHNNIILNADPQGGIWSGPGVSQNLFIPKDGMLGANTLWYKVPDANNCIAEKSWTIYNIPVPILDSSKQIGDIYQLWGNFPFYIQIEVKGVVHTTTYQNNSQASFTDFAGVTLRYGDPIIITSTVGGCYLIDTYKGGSPLGIENQEVKLIQEGDVIEVYNMLGSRVISIHAPETYKDVEMYKVGKLFNDLSTGMYIWKSGKISKKFIPRQ